MAKIDRLNKEIDNLKSWNIIIVTSIFGIIAWLVIYFGEVELLKTILGIIALIPLYIALLVIDKNMKEKLDQIEKE